MWHTCSAVKLCSNSQCNWDKSTFHGSTRAAHRWGSWGGALQAAGCILSLLGGIHLHLELRCVCQQNEPRRIQLLSPHSAWKSLHTARAPRLLLLPCSLSHAGVCFSFQVYLVNIAGVDISREVLSNGAANHTARFVLEHSFQL